MPGEVVRMPVDPVTRICNAIEGLTKVTQLLADNMENASKDIEAMGRRLASMESMVDRIDDNINEFGRGRGF